MRALIVWILVVSPVIGQGLTLSRDQVEILIHAQPGKQWYTADGVLHWDESLNGPTPTIADIESWRSGWEAAQTKSVASSAIRTNDDSMLLWTETLTRLLVQNGTIRRDEIPAGVLDAINQRLRLRGEPPL